MLVFPCCFKVSHIVLNNSSVSPPAIDVLIICMCLCIYIIGRSIQDLVDNCEVPLAFSVNSVSCFKLFTITSKFIVGEV